MLVFNKYFYKNKKSKLYFGDRVAVLNDFIYQTGGSISRFCCSIWYPRLVNVMGMGLDTKLNPSQIIGF
jgi:hypothetical protein